MILENTVEELPHYNLIIEGTYRDDWQFLFYNKGYAEISDFADVLMFDKHPYELKGRFWLQDGEILSKEEPNWDFKQDLELTVELPECERFFDAVRSFYLEDNRLFIGEGLGDRYEKALPTILKDIDDIYG